MARIRRIFPSLFLVLLAATSIGWMILLASDFRELGKHIASGAGFVSNITLWRESGYFDSDTEKKPLLYLWSLGVEEQFYVLFPLLIWLAYRLRVRTILLVIVLITGSFAFNLYFVKHDSASAFYLPHTRFWELMVGSFLASIEVSARLSHDSVRHSNLKSFLGMALLVAGVYEINAAREFPGWWAVLPTFGAALLISGRDSWINRNILSMRVLVWIGLISYPLYLWHWVLLSFCHIFEDTFPFYETRNPAIILSFFFAWLTYLYVEKPIRFGRLRTISAGYLVGPMIAIFLIGLLIYIADGVRGRAAAELRIINPGDIGHREFNAYLQKKFYLCDKAEFRQGALVWDGQLRCFQSKVPGYHHDVVVMGDSHAEHLFIGLAEKFGSLNFIYLTRNGLPLISNSEFEKIFDSVIADKGIGSVVLSAHWGAKLNSANEAAFWKDMAKTITVLKDAGKRVYLFADVPQFTINPERCAYDGLFFRTNSCIDSASGFKAEELAFSNRAEDLKERGSDFFFIRPARFFCDEVACTMAKNGTLFYRDRNHLNILGSSYLSDSLLTSYPNLFSE